MSGYTLVRSSDLLTRTAIPSRIFLVEQIPVPVADASAFGLAVTGRIPREQNGHYPRVGPNVLGLEDPRAHHWMQGDDFPAYTHVIPYKGRVLALQESRPLPYELDGDLNTVRPYDFRSTLEGAFTAHTEYDAKADELHGISYYPALDHVRHLVIDHTGRVVRDFTGRPVARVHLAGRVPLGFHGSWVPDA
ncbi:carotenoid oxygenase family protein [Streptomyces sp. NBC_01511]|uniref:carotenoid oxygenase family protein n=1 Tax=Streptomyces sp. NBC_01511 TaxID=2903889 RepID=UPI003865E8ED